MRTAVLGAGSVGGAGGLARLPPEVRRDRAALTLVFFLLGALAASWASRIPAVKGALHLSPGALGVALLGPAIGLVASAAPTGAALTRWRPLPVMGAGIALYTISLPFIAFAGGEVSLFLILLAWGVGSGIIDVAMNTEATALQSRASRPIMSGLHAAYSVGGLVGAGAGALAAAGGVAYRWHLLTAAATCALLGLGALMALRRSPAPPPHPGGHRQLPPPNRGLLALAAVAFGCFLAEGAVNDWSGVYLHSALGSPLGYAALGYTVFASAMTAGRLAGDRLGHRFGPVAMVRTSTFMAGAGFATVLLVGRPGVSLAGFAVLGLGLSVVVPQVFSAAGRLGAPGPSLALVTGCGYAGLMAGPPLIGALAEAVGLPTALGVIVAVAALACVLAPSLRPGMPPAPAPSIGTIGVDGGSETGDGPGPGPP